MKNPDNKPLRIRPGTMQSGLFVRDYSQMLTTMMSAQAMLIKSGKNSALPHFIAIIKELERLYDFTFEKIDV